MRWITDSWKWVRSINRRGSLESGLHEEIRFHIDQQTEKLRHAGATLLICPDNTVHQGLDLVRDRSPLPWLHIAEEVASVAAERGYRRLLILGTKYLMEGPVYSAKLRSSAIECEIPPADERIHINALIFDELVYGRFENSARAPVLVEAPTESP